MVRAEVIETSSQVWKTCILTAVLHPRVLIIAHVRIWSLGILEFDEIGGEEEPGACADGGTDDDD